jgi:DNA mismatch repair protein MutS
MKVNNDQIEKIVLSLMQEVEALVEDHLILQIRDNLTLVQRVLAKIAKLDIGVAFVQYIRSNRQSNVWMSCPIFVDEVKDCNVSPVFLLKSGTNPLLLKAITHKPAPNDVYADNLTKLWLVNGPNGSGKTTLLRMLALSIILAQIGCYVPCNRFALTPFQFLFHKATDDQTS